MSTFDEDYESWTDKRIGLEYERTFDIVIYRPHKPFWVDGIRYDPDGGAGVLFQRQMVQSLDCGDIRGAHMACSRPPTDTELDHWVRTGNFDGHRMP